MFFEILLWEKDVKFFWVFFLFDGLCEEWDNLKDEVINLKVIVKDFKRND